jgi:hypothetical protein
MSRRHRGSATSARRHLAKAIGSAALGPLNQPSSKCRFNRKTTSRTRTPFRTGFSEAPQPLPTRSRRVERRCQGRVLVRAGPEITNRGDRRCGRGSLSSAGDRTFQLIRPFGPRPIASLDWSPPGNLNDRSARPRKTRPPNSCPTYLAGWLRIIEKMHAVRYARVLQRRWEMPGVIGGLWVSLTKQRCKGNRSYEC